MASRWHILPQEVDSLEEAVVPLSKCGYNVSFSFRTLVLFKILLYV